MAPRKKCTPKVRKKMPIIIKDKKEEFITDGLEHFCYRCRDTGSTKFYITNNDLYAGVGYLPICKKCTESVHGFYVDKYKDSRMSLFFTCRRLGLYYSHNAHDAALKHSIKTGWTLIQSYFKTINSLTNNNGCGHIFDDTKDFISDGNIDNPTDRSLEDDLLEYDDTFSEQDEKAKEDVIRILGKDPFESYSKFDQKLLYGELLPFLDEDSLADPFKISMITQVVKNNSQIAKIDLIINKLSTNIKELKNNEKVIYKLTEMKNKIVSSTDKVAKENNISVKNRGDNKSGKGTLTDLMRTLREYQFAAAENDFYNQLKAIGYKRAADISNASILDQLKFDENDLHDMLKTQKTIIEKQNNEIDDLKEQIRKIYIVLQENDISLI